jgi:hypothetical protein
MKDIESKMKMLEKYISQGAYIESQMGEFYLMKYFGGYISKGRNLTDLISNIKEEK